MASAPIYVGSSKTAGFQFVNGTGTTVTTVVTAGANGSRISALTATSTDTAQRILDIYVQPGGSGTAYLIGSVTIPIGAGTGGAAAVNLLNALQLAGYVLEDGSIGLGINDKLQIAAEVAVTTAKQVNVVAWYGDY